MPNWEPLVEPLVEGAFAIVDDLLPGTFLYNLHQHIHTQHSLGHLRPAGIQRHGELQTQIRGDSIQWIDPTTECQIERSVLILVDELRLYLNRTCYTSLGSIEAQMAHYDPDSFYKPHRDQFQGCLDRQFTWILYLNPNWSELDGGKLKLYLKSKEVEIEPKWGRVVLFRSNIVHEVLPTSTPRISVSGWLRSRSD